MSGEKDGEKGNDVLEVAVVEELIRTKEEKSTLLFVFKEM
jgi:hypothetical protein